MDCFGTAFLAMTQLSSKAALVEIKILKLSLELANVRLNASIIEHWSAAYTLVSEHRSTKYRSSKAALVEL